MANNSFKKQMKEIIDNWTTRLWIVTRRHEAAPLDGEELAIETLKQCITDVENIVGTKKKGNIDG